MQLEHGSPVGGATAYAGRSTNLWHWSELTTANGLTAFTRALGVPGKALPTQWTLELRPPTGTWPEPSGGYACILKHTRSGEVWFDGVVLPLAKP